MKVQVLSLGSARRTLAAILLGLSVLALGIASHWPAPAKADDRPPGAASGLGQLTGLLPRNQLVLESALQVDLTQETVRLPLYKGTANGHDGWFILTGASDVGLAHTSGINYAPKLANVGTSCPESLQPVTLHPP